MLMLTILFLVIAFVFASVSSVNAQKNKFEKSIRAVKDLFSAAINIDKDLAN